MNTIRIVTEHTISMWSIEFFCFDSDARELFHDFKSPIYIWFQAYYDKNANIHLFTKLELQK